MKDLAISICRMKLLPSCSYYLRRILRQYLTLSSHGTVDLLENSEGSPRNLEQRLHRIYSESSSCNNIVLHIERLVFSHQQAHSYQNDSVKQEILYQILWWLGYSTEAARSQPPKVLIVEDSLEVLHLTSTLLNTRGYRIDSALSGYLALEKIQAYPPDLILLDICLPDINGDQIYERLQDSPQTSQIPVIFLTGIEESIGERLRASKHPSYLTKPFQPEELFKLVEQHLEDLGGIKQNLDRSAELETRQKQAQQQDSITGSRRLSEELDAAHYFFRATLDGRYLRVSPALAKLCGFESSGVMMRQINNLWEQVYGSIGHRKHWDICLQHPNQNKTLSTQIRNCQDQFLEVVENICLIHDAQQRPLFFQGFFILN